MKGAREQTLEERRRLKDQYGEMFDSIVAVLYRADPIGVSFENPNSEEYAPEAGAILTRLGNCDSVDDALSVVQEEFFAALMPTMLAQESSTVILLLKSGAFGRREKLELPVRRARTVALDSASSSGCS